MYSSGPLWPACGPIVADPHQNAPTVATRYPGDQRFLVGAGDGNVGSRRTFGPGDLLRAKATEGTGHVTRPVGDPPVEALFLSG